MQVELGNAAPRSADGSAVDDGEHRVTYVNIPDEAYELDLGAAPSVEQLALHLLQADGGVTKLPGLEPLLAIVHPDGAWARHSTGKPTWVYSGTHPELAEFLGEFFGCPVGRPDNVEDTHWTRSGMPGVGPTPDDDVVMLKTNAGNDIQNSQMFRGGGVLGQTGTASATTATSLTGSAEAPGGSHASNDAAGMCLVAWSNGAIANVLSNTTGTTPVYTIDRWYVPGTPGGAAATTPSGTTGYTLISGGLPAFFVGLTATAGAPASGDTTLSGEITTVGGGLIRKIAPTAHTAGTNTTTLTPVFTANGTDSLPVTIAKIGVSQSLLSAALQLFQTLLNATATLTASGDQLTITETITT
jgi:hypothetical protein